MAYSSYPQFDDLPALVGFHRGKVTVKVKTRRDADPEKPVEEYG